MAGSTRRAEAPGLSLSGWGGRCIELCPVAGAVNGLVTMEV